MKSGWMIPMLLLLSCLGLMSCSNSDAPDDNNLNVGENEQDDGNGQASIEELNSEQFNSEQFSGTWKSDCIALSTNEAKLVTFIYDGQRAAFRTELHDSACSSTPILKSRTGKITFQDIITDTAFGASAHAFVFDDDDPTASDFQDLLYIEDNLMYFGDPGTKPSESKSPTGLDLSQPFRFQGAPDFSVLEDNQQNNTVNVEFEIERFDGAIADSPERAISTDALVLEVLVNDQLVQMMPESTVWTGSIRVSRDSSISIDITWSEVFAGSPLPLAQAQTNLETDASDQNFKVVVTPDSYDTGFDQDGDGFSNLEERINNTDPLDADDSPGTL